MCLVPIIPSSQRSRCRLGAHLLVLQFFNATADIITAYCDEYMSIDVNILKGMCQVTTTNSC